VSKLGKRLIQAAREGVAIARGELDPSTYRVHHDDDADAGRSRVSFMRQMTYRIFRTIE
jgi:putative transcriptional regulator